MLEWRYELTPRAMRDMRHLEVETRSRVFRALDLYVAERRGDVLKLQGHPAEWRLRVGDHRVRFSPDAEKRVIVVLRVLHRREAY